MTLNEKIALAKREYEQAEALFSSVALEKADGMTVSYVADAHRKFQRLKSAAENLCALYIKQAAPVGETFRLLRRKHVSTYKIVGYGRGTEVRIENVSTSEELEQWISFDRFAEMHANAAKEAR